jgi:hypothetical protein
VKAFQALKFIQTRNFFGGRSLTVESFLRKGIFSVIPLDELGLADGDDSLDELILQFASCRLFGTGHPRKPSVSAIKVLLKHLQSNWCVKDKYERPKGGVLTTRGCIPSLAGTRLSGRETIPAGLLAGTASTKMALGDQLVATMLARSREKESLSCMML